MNPLTSNTWLFGRDWGQFTLGVLPTLPATPSPKSIPEISVDLVTRINKAASMLLHGFSAFRCYIIRFVDKEALFSCREKEQWALAKSAFEVAGVKGVLGFGVLATVLALACRLTLQGGLSLLRSPSTSTDTSPRPELQKQVFLSSGIKNTLNELLPRGSPFERLPFITEEDLKKGHFTSPIMKGLVKSANFDSTLPFVVIRVEHADDALQKATIHLQQLYDQNNETYGSNAQYVWGQLLRDKGPQFFTAWFTASGDGTGPVVGQETGFGLLQTLLREKKGTDINGDTWKLVEVEKS